MKSHFYLLFISIVIISCSQKPSISGYITIPEDSNFQEKVYLIQPNKLDEVAASFFGKVIDSAAIGKDGSFQFKKLPTLLEPTLFELAVQQKGNLPNQLSNENPVSDNYMPIVWQPGETIEITAKADTFQQSIQIKNPSKVNAALVALRDIKREAFQTYLATKEFKVHDGSQLLEKEEAVVKYQKALIQFAANANELLPALVALRWVSPQNDYERVPEFLFQQCEQWKNNPHPWRTALCEKANKERLPVLIGDLFPNATVPLVTGDTLSLSSQLGRKLTIVDLWASWCVPCRKENREILVPLWDTYHAQGLQIIAYGLETSEEAWKNAIQKDGAYRWVHASDLQGDEAALMKTLRIQTIPANFILDNEGRVIAKNSHGEDLELFVKNYFKTQ